MTNKPKRTLSAPPAMPVKKSSQALKPKTALSSLMTTKDVIEHQQKHNILRFIAHYPADVVSKVQGLIDAGTLNTYLEKRYPEANQCCTDKTLYDLAFSLKNEYMRQSAPIAKVIYDEKITLSHQALGLHSFVNRRQGNKVKAKNEIRIASRLKTAPFELMKMVLVHELAHLKEKEHNKAFYQLCSFMMADYHQKEFDMKLLLILDELADKQS